MTARDYIFETAQFLVEANPFEEALDLAKGESRHAFEAGNLARHQFWKFVFDRIEEVVLFDPMTREHEVSYSAKAKAPY